MSRHFTRDEGKGTKASILRWAGWIVMVALSFGCRGTAHLPTAPPDDEVSEIDCDRTHGSGNVYVTAQQFAKRLGASAKKFSEVR